MSNQIAVVTNATGTQGRSVVRALSEAGYQVRALTRDASSPKAAELKGVENVQLVECDVNRRDSIRSAFQGAHVVYAYTIPDYALLRAAPDERVEREGPTEVEQGTLYADVAKETNVGIFIWATTPDAGKISKGKYAGMRHFEERLVVQRHIQQIGIPSFFVLPSIFMENFDKFQSIKLQDDGTLALTMQAANLTDAVYPLLYVEADFGRAIALLVKNFDKAKTKSIKLFERNYSIKEMCEIFTSLTGRNVTVVSEHGMFAKGSDIDKMYRYFADAQFTCFEDGDVPEATLQALGFKFTPLSTYVKDKMVVKFKGKI